MVTRHPAGRSSECGAVRGVGLKVSVEFWTEELTGPLPETARFFSKHRVPPHPGDTLFVSEETLATRPGDGGGDAEPGPTAVRVRVVGTFRVTGRFWSVPGEELTVNVRPVGDGDGVVRLTEDSPQRAAPWIEHE